MRVVLINRKPRKLSNFSIESYFRSVYEVLRKRIHCFYFVLSDESNAIFPRIRAVREVKRIDADVYHITGDVHFLTLGTPGSKTLLTIHDCGFMREKNPLKRWFLWLFWLKIPVSRVGLISCVSGETKKEIIAYTGCRPEKITVIPTVVSKQFIPVPKPFNEQYPTILHVGTKPNKNLLRLITALEGISCRLVIIGKLNEAYLSQLKTSHVEYENYVDISEEELLGQYVRADIVCFVSTFEGFGMPIVEGQLTGRPVVTSNCSSMPEVAGKAACLADPLDTSSIRKGILRIIFDREYRDELVKNGFENAKRFDIETVAGQYISLYEKIA